MGSNDYHINLTKLKNPPYHAPERHDGRNSSKAAYIREKLGSKGKEKGPRTYGIMKNKTGSTVYFCFEK